MNAALIWAINNFPTYVMVSYWSTHVKLTCPYYMENNKAFSLTNGGKMSFLLLPVFLANELQVQKEHKRFHC